MPAHNHLELYYHLVWHTKTNIPYLTEETEKIVFGFINKKCIKLNYNLFAINGTEDHTHVIIELPATVCVAEAVKNIKGSSSDFINNKLDDDQTLYWQSGYGAFTISKKYLKKAIEYVKNQKTHHKQNTAISFFEKVFIEENDNI